jgi:glycosidase
MYSVYVRQFSPEGTFQKVREALPRIRDPGVDILWLLPIHPVGEKARNGALGSPYAIRDYRAVNPEFGTLEDFRDLVDAVHALGMRCIIDVVYNHTSPDSALSWEHPEWFYHKPDGAFGNRIGEWSDIIDLDYNQPGLWDYQIETLVQWARIIL